VSPAGHRLGAMGVRRTVPRSVPPGRTAVLVGALAAATLLSGCTGGSTTPARRSPTPSPTPLERIDLSGLAVHRGPFCDLLDPRHVETVLGGPVVTSDSYRSGDETELAPGVTDVAHEFGCRFTGRHGSQARVWIFAAPVTEADAHDLVAQARTQPPATVVTVVGLFGDAWLSCQLSAPPAEPGRRAVPRAERWCVQVATRLSR
jgi:hypothetical protein